MIKSKIKLTIPLCGLLLLSSCRTEELLHEVEQKEELSKKFITFTKKHENDVIDYGEGFKYLALRYDSIHKTNMTGRADIAKLEEELQTNEKISFSKSNEVAYIDFNVRSQLMEEENGDKWMVFPKVRGRKVEDLIVALLSKEETLLSYYTIDKESEFYKENIGNFERVYKLSNKRGYYHMGLYDIRVFSSVQEREIEEVIIVVPKPLPAFPMLPIFPSFPIDGPLNEIECIYVDNCMNHGGSGGGGTSSPLPPPPKSNPCDNIKKNVVNNPNMKEPLKKLTEKSKLSGEQGFKVKADGTTTEMINGDAYSVSLGDMTGYAGAYHNHTPNGIKMQSIPDIMVLFQQILQRDKNVDVSSVFNGMIGTEACPSCEGGYKHYNYLISFKGTEEEATEIYIKYRDYDFEEERQWYRNHSKMILMSSPHYRDVQLNSKFLSSAGLEKLFFDSLKHINLDVNKFLLQKIDEKGNISNISMENNASLFPNENPCN